MSASKISRVSGRKPRLPRVCLTAAETQRLDRAGGGTLTWKEQIRANCRAALRQRANLLDAAKAVKRGYSMGLTEAEIEQMQRDYAT